MSDSQRESGDGLKIASGPTRPEDSDRECEAETISKSGGEQVNNSATLTTILSQPVHDVFVQHDKSFRRTDRKQYERMLEARTNLMMGISPSESVQSALTVQTIFHNTSHIMQGFLSGFGTAHAIFAFVFADADILSKSYIWLAMPTQATFYICFVISTVAAFDRFEMGSGVLGSLKRGLSLHGGGLNILLCLGGTITTLASTAYDEWLATPLTQRHRIQEMVGMDSLATWRWLSGFRALAALLSWLLLALSPNNNFLLKQIRNPEAEHEECERS